MPYTFHNMTLLLTLNFIVENQKEWKVCAFTDLPFILIFIRSSEEAGEFINTGDIKRYTISRGILRSREADGVNGTLQAVNQVEVMLTKHGAFIGCDENE